jgi:DNA-binding NarL/FixJ family response regulator
MTRFWQRLPQTGELALPLQGLRTATGEWRAVHLKASFLPDGLGEKKEILVIGKMLHMGSILEFLRLALSVSPDIQEQAVLRECLLLCTQGLPDNLAPRIKVRLTRRERAVLPLVARGFSSREIADALGILEPTVNKHRENLRKKFNVHNTVDLVQAAKKGKFIK